MADNANTQMSAQDSELTLPGAEANPCCMGSEASVSVEVLLGFVGILILLRPDVPSGEYTATLIGLLSGLLTALAYFNVGKLVRTGERKVFFLY